MTKQMKTDSCNEHFPATLSPGAVDHRVAGILKSGGQLPSSARRLYSRNGAAVCFKVQTFPGFGKIVLELELRMDRIFARDVSARDSFLYAVAIDSRAFCGFHDIFF